MNEEKTAEALTRDDFMQAVARAGGPKAIQAAFDGLRLANDRLDKEYSRILEQYPRHWIAMGPDGMIANVPVPEDSSKSYGEAPQSTSPLGGNADDAESIFRLPERLESPSHVTRRPSRFRQAPASRSRLATEVQSPSSAIDRTDFDSENPMTFCPLSSRIWPTLMVFTSAPASMSSRTICTSGLSGPTSSAQQALATAPSNAVSMENCPWTGPLKFTSIPARVMIRTTSGDTVEAWNQAFAYPSEGGTDIRAPSSTSRSARAIRSVILDS